jgi:hypothetical protein
MIPIKNAPIGDVILCTNALRRVLHQKGTSITNHLPYQKTSFKFANHTKIPRDPAMNFIRFVFVVDEKFFHSPNHNKK